MKLTDHFTLEEMCVTNTGLKNECPSFAICSRLHDLCSQLEIIREYLGRSIKVNSGYRSAAVNKAVGGVSSSAHLSGCAADISSSNYDSLVKAVNQYIDNKLPFDQIIFYPERRFIHFGFRRSNFLPRMQVLTK